MKKLISTAFSMVFVIVIALVVYKGVTKKSAVHEIWVKYEKVIDMNRKAPAGDTLSCPICDKEFIKGVDGCPFCSPACEKKYSQIVKNIHKEGKLEDGILEVYDVAKEKIKKALEDEPSDN